MKYLAGLLVFASVFCSVSTAKAQWWGSDALPGNPSYYTYRTRFGYWQYGSLERNITTPQPFADRGIIRDWTDGSPIAVDRNVSGGRFAQAGVPGLVYVPQINYYDNLGYLTDIQYQSGLRQYWPEDEHLLIDEWEQITYEPDSLPAASAQRPATPSTAMQNQPVVAVARPQESRNRVQTVVVQQVPLKPAPKKLTYHQRVMQGHAERRAAEEERNRQRAEQLAEQNRQRDELIRRQQSADQFAYSQNATNTQYALPQLPTAADPLWFRDQVPQTPTPLTPLTAPGSLPGYGSPPITYTIPADPTAEQEKRLEYALAQSPEVSFFSPFQAKFENGTVTVSGVVGSEQQRQAAERILLAQPGVQRVQNNLTF